MTAIDFSAFVNELAAVSGETILPFFRTTLSVEDKGRPGSFDPVTAADRAAETAGIAFLLLKKCQRQLRCQAQGGPPPQSSLTTLSVTWANTATESTRPLLVCRHWILAHPVF